jgi:hypothetical protein
MVRRLEHRFPGLRTAVVTTAVPEKVTSGLYAYWLFNRGGLTSAVERGSNNRLIFLQLDLLNESAVAMVGYGLEPFFGQDTLQECLQAMAADLRDGQVADAVLLFWNEVEKQLQAIAKQLPEIFGIGAPEFEGLRAVLMPDAAEEF